MATHAGKTGITGKTGKTGFIWNLAGKPGKKVLFQSLKAGKTGKLFSS